MHLHLRTKSNDFCLNLMFAKYMQFTKGHLICISCLSLLSSAAFSADTSATQYLNAWLYRDFPRMYALSAPAVKKQMTEQQFTWMASALPSPSSEPKIVQLRANSDGSHTYYVEYRVEKKEEPVRTSISESAMGVAHPELSARFGSGQTQQIGQPSQLTPAQQAAQTPVIGSRAPSGIALAPFQNNTPNAADAKSIDGLTAQDILAKMNKAAETAETLRAQMTLKGSVLGTEINESGKMIYMAPNRMHMTFSRFVMNSTGQKSVLYLADSNMVLDLGSLGDFELSPGIGSSAGDLQKKYQVTLVGKTQIGQEPAIELNLKPVSSGQGALASFMGSIGGGNMRMWVSANHWLPLRAQMDAFTVEYRGLEINPRDVKESSFAYSPPADAQSISLSSLLGGMGNQSLPMF